MSVYIFDLLVGYEPNGVDSSQAHRARLFRKMNIDSHYIFSVIPPRYKFMYFRNLGIPQEKMMIAPFYLAGEKDVTATITVEEIIQRLGLKEKEYIKKNDTEIVYQITEEHTLLLLIEKNKVYQVEHLYQDKLYQRDYYTSYLVCREQLQEDSYHWYQRFFYNASGELVYTGIQQNDKIQYQFKYERVDGEIGLIERFIKALHLTEKDTIIMDRFFGFSRPLLENAKNVKKGFFFHAYHKLDFGMPIFEYQYLFKVSPFLDFMIVSTELQKKDIEEHLAALKVPHCKIEVIPAASLETLGSRDLTSHQHHAMIAGRFVPQKQMDVAIEVAFKVREMIPDFHLNIYGQGGGYDALNQLIVNNHAQEYIKLCGYKNLKQEFPKHSLYISTSHWETLGITLLEALSFGLGLVGMNAPYGTPTFISEGKNGYLVPQSEKMTREEKINLMADAIVKFYKLDQQKVARQSHDIAKEYLDEVVAQKWWDLIQR